MIKKICMCLMCMLFALSMFGCSNITLKTVQKENGNIVSSIEVDITGLNSSTRSTIYEFSEEYVTELNNAYEDSLVDLFSHVYDFASLNKVYTEEKVSYILLNNPTLIAGDVSISPSKQLALDNLNNNKMTVSVSFLSIYGYLMYFCPKAFVYDSENNSIKIDSENYSTLVDVPIICDDYSSENGAFIDKIEQVCVPFSYNGNEPKLMSVFKTYSVGTSLVSAICQELHLDSTQAQYVYNFVTPFARLHSDAQVEQTSQGYSHTWSLGNDVEATITVWRNYANQTLWYVVALVIGLLFVGVAFLVIYLVKKKKKKEGMQALQKIDDFVNKQ